VCCAHAGLRVCWLGSPGASLPVLLQSLRHAALLLTPPCHGAVAAAAAAVVHAACLRVRCCRWATGWASTTPSLAAAPPLATAWPTQVCALGLQEGAAGVRCWVGAAACWVLVRAWLLFCFLRCVCMRACMRGRWLPATPALRRWGLPQVSCTLHRL
jgi:hypothetical protein